jgi:hypothetical protein
MKWWSTVWDARGKTRRVSMRLPWPTTEFKSKMPPILKDQYIPIISYTTVA